MIDLWPVLMSPLNPRDLRLAIIIIIIIIITPWRVRVPPRFDWADHQDVLDLAVSGAPGAPRRYLCAGGRHLQGADPRPSQGTRGGRVCVCAVCVPCVCRVPFVCRVCLIIRKEDGECMR